MFCSPRALQFGPQVRCEDPGIQIRELSPWCSPRMPHGVLKPTEDTKDGMIYIDTFRSSSIPTFAGSEKICAHPVISIAPIIITDQGLGTNSSTEW
jgi:hypothetical protein